MGNLPSLSSLNPLDSTIQSGVSVINHSGDNITSIVRDVNTGIVTAYRTTANNVAQVYRGTEKDFFATANNLGIELSNLGQTIAKGSLYDIDSFQKNGWTVIDDWFDNLHLTSRDIVQKVFNTIAWIISLGFLGFLLISIFFGADILRLVEKILERGLKLGLN